MASRGEITEPKEGGRRSGGRRWQQRGWKQHRAPRRDPRHATATLKRRIQRHVLVDTAADRYDARHLQVIISLVPFRFSFSAFSVHVCVCVCVSVEGKRRGERERCELKKKKKLSFWRCICVFLKHDICWRMKVKLLLIISESDLENLISRLGEG